MICSVCTRLKYSFANDLSLSTSLTVNALNPKSERTPNIPVNARAKDKIPKPAAP